MIRNLAAIILLLAASAMAQRTTVTAQITDTNGTTYAGGSFTASLPNGVVYTLGGAPQRQAQGQLDSTGSFTVSLADTSLLTPPGTKWTFNICAADGKTCFTSDQSVSGASQSLSTALSAASTPYYALNVVSGKVGNLVLTGTCTGCTSGSGTVTSVATTAPLGGGPISTTGTLTCTTCVTSAAALTSGQLLAGAGSQASAVTDLTGDVTTSGAVATTLAAKYKTKSCTISLGDGLNAIPAGTYPLLGMCKNDTGATLTLTGLKCLSDNNGTTSCNAADSGSNALLTGAITATTAYAAGTQSATTTIASGVWINVTFVADGTSKVVTLDIAGTL